MWKKASAKTVAWFAAVILTLTVTVGAVVAYLAEKTDPLENTFQPVSVSCEVQGDLAAEVKSNVAVKNTGDIDAYVRAAILVTWVSEENGNAYAAMPQENVDYTFTLGSTDWAFGADGFYYYRSAVASGNSTAALIGEMTQILEAPTGYKLTVQVFASAIQAQPSRAVEETWGVTVSSDGLIVAP